MTSLLKRGGRNSTFSVLMLLKSSFDKADFEPLLEHSLFKQSIILTPSLRFCGRGGLEYDGPLS